MALWNRKNFEEAAQQIGKSFVASAGKDSINSLATKIAQEAQLNPDGIRTIVRLANVSAFEEMFGKRAEDKATDRMIEFEVGDPEVIINNLYSSAKSDLTSTKTASDYNRTADFYGDIAYPKPALEKTATVISGIEMQVKSERPPSKAEVQLLFKRAEDKMKAEKAEAEAAWFGTMEKAARSLIVLDGRIDARTAFEKTAISSLGTDVIPELNMLQRLTSPKSKTTSELCGGEKIAHVLDTHIAVVSREQKPIIEMIKKACALRQTRTQLQAGLDWIDTNRARIG